MSDHSSAVREPFGTRRITGNELEMLISALEALSKGERSIRHDWQLAAFRELKQFRILIAALKVAAGTDAEGDALVVRVRQLRSTYDREAPHCSSCSCGEPILGRRSSRCPHGVSELNHCEKCD